MQLSQGRDTVVGQTTTFAGSKSRKWLHQSPRQPPLLRAGFCGLDGTQQPPHTTPLLIDRCGVWHRIRVACVWINHWISLFFCSCLYPCLFVAIFICFLISLQSAGCILNSNSSSYSKIFSSICHLPFDFIVFISVIYEPFWFLHSPIYPSLFHFARMFRKPLQPIDQRILTSLYFFRFFFWFYFLHLTLQPIWKLFWFKAWGTNLT